MSTTAIEDVTRQGIRETVTALRVPAVQMLCELVR
jgi:hypothetical protein